MFKRSVILLLLSLLVAPHAKTKEKDHDLPQIEAIRTEEKIEIDGRLTESIWKRNGYTKLIQRDPIEGSDPTEETSVLLAYNVNGLYVAGTCYHSGQDSVIGGLARRDRIVESDWFWFWIDPNNDRQNGFGFAVNPDGSIIDQKLYQDIYENNDWDGLWEAAAQRLKDHWSFEMFIPYSQLRFSKKDEYVWGVNFARYVLANAEHDFFVMVPKEETGFVSRFGQLTGLRNIAPPARLFVSPYVMTKINDFPDFKESPFFHGQKYSNGMGLDIKYGLTGNLTLDLAINPDFGQAEVDPALINLSAFETFYAEKRAFFIEGSDIFRFGANPAGGVWGCYWSDPTIFYSRRIGRQPNGSPSHEGQALMPEQTTILGAAKVSGKMGKWSIGSITAMTQQEFATVEATDGTRFKDLVEPQSYYGALRASREINEGDQGLGLIVTGVARDQDTPELQSINNTNALVGGIDGWTFFGKNRDWALMGKFAYSSVFGTEERITRLQKTSTHYYQRPDFESVSLDTTRTSLSGYMGRFGFLKMRGNFLFQTALGFISPGFNVNDLGYNAYGNVLNMHVVFGHRWLEPTSWFRRLYLSAMTSRNFDYDGNRLFQQYYFAASMLLLNYLSFNTSFQYTPDGLDLFDTRGGPIMAYPGYTYSNFTIQTDSRKSIQGILSGSYNNSMDGSYSKNAGVGLILKASSSMKFTLSADYSWALNHQQWVNNLEDPAAEYGHHYVFGTINQKVASATVRLDWGLTQRLSLQCYLQPFIAVGDYDDFKELARARSYDFNPYDYTEHDPDFNYKSFKGNVVLRWEYLPGSLLYLVWTQDRGNYDRPGEFRLGKDLETLFGAQANNIFFVKMSYNISIF